MALRELKTIDEYHAWLRAMDEAKWRGVVYGEQEPVDQYVTIPRDLLSHPRYDEVRPGDRMAELDVETGAYELVRAIREGDVVLDVGAHVGYFTRLAAKKGARVFALEPQPRNAARLRLLASDRVEVRQLACWSESFQRIDFHESLSSTEGSVRRTEVKVATYQVSTLAIDDMQLPRLDFMKIDVEGAELQVFLGAERTLERCRPFVVAEVFDDVSEVRALLERHRYSVKIQPLMSKPDLVDETVKGLWHCTPS